MVAYIIKQFVKPAASCRSGSVSVGAFVCVCEKMCQDVVITLPAPSAGRKLPLCQELGGRMGGWCMPVTRHHRNAMMKQSVKQALSVTA